ncbi:MAG: phosphatase PAP2 family protein [Candidatus Kariarchaeaceae archaeon]
MFRGLINEITKNRFYEYIRGFMLHLKTSFITTIRWPWLVFHLLSIFISILLVLGGIDWSFFLFYHGHKILQIALFPAVVIGGITPLIVPPIIYLYAKRENKPYLEPLAYALTQAAVVATIWIAIYKAITGRLQPELFEGFDEDYSNNFAFGFLRRGVFHGWPSTHTTVAWALAVVFFYYRPRTDLLVTNTDDDFPKFLKYQKYSFIYAFYIGFGVSSNIHWLSDAVAGALIGFSVGMAVNRTFEQYWDKNDLKQVKNVEVYLLFVVLFLLIIFSIVGFDDF